MAPQDEPSLAGGTASATELVDGELAPDHELLVLEATDLAARGRRFPLAGADVRVGRTAGLGERAIVLAWDTKVSARHAHLERRGDRWWILDDNSRHGTALNGSRISSPAPLTPGDRIQVGGTVLSYLGRPSVATSLPFPLATAHALVAAQTGPLARFRGLVGGIEIALKFLVALEIAAIRAQKGAAGAHVVAHELARCPNAQRGRMSMGDWEQLVWKLGACVDIRPGDPLGATLRRLVVGNRRSELGMRVLETVGLRNVRTHEPLTNERALEQDEPILAATFSEFIEAFRPLSSTELVSVATIVGFKKAGIAYDLYVHRGGTELFPVERHVFHSRLVTEWCYLMGPTWDEPLCLAPMVGAATSEVTRRLEVFFAVAPTFGGEGAPVRMRAVTTPSQAELPLPDDDFLGAVAHELEQPR